MPTSSSFSLQVANAASTALSALLTSLSHIKSRMSALWRGEEAATPSEPAKDAENTGAAHAIKDTRTSNISETPAHPEHTQKAECLEAVESRKDNSGDNDSIKDDDGLMDDEDDQDEEEDEDEDDEDEDDEDEDDEDEDDEDDEDEDDEDEDDEDEVDENDPEYIALKDFVVNNVIIDDERIYNSNRDRINMAVRLVEAVNNNKFFPVSSDVFCLAASIYSNMYETMSYFHSQILHSIRYLYADDNDKYVNASSFAIDLACFIDDIRNISRKNKTNELLTSKETAR